MSSSSIKRSVRLAAVTLLVGISTPAIAEGSAVTYTGPTTISGITRLTASTTLSSVVGINWRIDNKAFGTASVSPYNFDANAALLPSGQHTMTVIAIDRNGTRTVSPEVRVNIGGAPTGAGIVHLTGTSGGRTLSSGQTVYGNGSTTIINGKVTMGSNSRLENLVVNGTIRGARGARVSQVTINPPSSPGYAVQFHDTARFTVQDSTINCHQSTGDIKGIWNTNFESGSNDVILARNKIANCGGDGIWLITASNDVTTYLLRPLLLDNTISGSNGPYDNGTEARGVIVGGLDGTVIGNKITGGTTAGVEPFRSATDMTFAHNTVANSPVAFYLEHFADGSIFEYNTVHAISTGFNIEWVADSNPPRSTKNAHIIRNQITAPIGVFADAGSTGIETGFNTIDTSTLPTIIYQGSSHGSIHDNVIYTTASGNPIRVYDNAGFTGSLRWPGRRSNVVQDRRWRTTTLASFLGEGFVQLLEP